MENEFDASTWYDPSDDQQGLLGDQQAQAPTPQPQIQPQVQPQPNPGLRGTLPAQDQPQAPAVQPSTPGFSGAQNDDPYGLNAAKAAAVNHISGATPATALPNPNALYSQMQANGVPSDFTKFAPGVSTAGMLPQAAKLADYVNTKYPDWTITSGYRDPTRNANAGGAGDSRHMHRDAFDVRPAAGITQQQKADFLKDVASQGARGLGVYPGGGLHVDLRTSNGPAIWGSDRHYGSFTREQSGPVLDFGMAFKAGTLGKPAYSGDGLNSPSERGPGPGQGPKETPYSAAGGQDSPSERGPGPGMGPKGPAPAAAPAGATPTPAGTGPVGAPEAAGKKNDMFSDANMQKISKALLSLAASRARGPLHYAPPASGGSPVNRPDVATPEAMRGTARILPKVAPRGILG